MQTSAGMATIYYMPQDDRVNALKYWCLKEIDLMLVAAGGRDHHGATSQVARELGVERGVITQAIKQGAQGGQVLACAIADHKRISAGQAWDESIRWWNFEDGREWARRKLKQIERARGEQFETEPPSHPGRKAERLKRVK